MQEQRVVRLYAADKLSVWASVRDSGALVIEGQDLDASRFFGDDVGEYEYGITVEPSDIPRVVAALGGEHDSDVLDLLETKGEEIVRSGETKWLKQAGVEPKFWSRMG